MALGDGREFIVSDPSLTQVQSEDGYVSCVTSRRTTRLDLALIRRPITGTNITPFINNLPFDMDTTAFTTENASGSTSMAAGIQELLEVIGNMSCIYLHSLISASRLAASASFLTRIRAQPIL